MGNVFRAVENGPPYRDAIITGYTGYSDSHRTQETWRQLGWCMGPHYMEYSPLAVKLLTNI